MQPKLYVLLSVFATVVSAWRPIGKTRTVRLTQGDVVGMVYESEVPELGPVEVYRGVPYAQAERYMPPSSPARFEWLDAVKNGPVCPQNLVDLDVGMKMGSGRSTSGRLAYLRRLIPFLKNQSEDCLNLNIYVPSQAYLNGLGGNLNVIVFIHGESFSWNSGNPYDGSTLASYGNVIFVTLNYRLGVLGFLNTRNNKTTGNFGLLDQIAALRWLKDNIASFGGDPNSITLMGHHTGAIAVNYLMLSPVAQADNGLFQRAILMSGTALSSWAHSKDPEEIAHALAEGTRCPMYDLLPCLRNKRLHEILGVKELPEDPAPSVDGIVVKVQPKDLMSHNNDLFTRYDLLCGVTESESHHVLDNVALRHGLYNEDVKELLTKYFRENFEHWEQSQERAMKVYGLDKAFMSPIEGRDKTLTLLSDARVVAPMVQTAVYHSTPGLDDIRTYFYVFSHRSKHGDHPSASMSVQGEDLAYVLGVPIEGGIHHFPADYSQEEKHLSETMMSLWINFAKTGNPNLPRRKNYLTKGHSDWALEDVDWPAFEPNSQHFYQIQIPPRIGTKYRDNLMHFWNYFLPTWIPSQSPPNKYTTSTKIEPEEDGKVSKFKFLEMYNPFVPASRTSTPPPPPPTDAPFEETRLPAILGVVCVLLMAFAVVTLVVNHYLKFLPCHRGRSLSLPSVEFDVEEILAALEWEKRSGERREQSATLDRNIIERGSDELVAVIGSVPSCSETIKSHKIVPEKPKRQHANDPKKPKSDVRGYTDDKMKKSRVTKEPKRKKSLAENQGSTTAAKKEAKEDETDEKSLTEQTPVEGYVDALDKIKKSHFPKVLPDFPFEHIDYEGDSTHEKRMMNRPPPNLENLTRKITPPSPPKVPIIFTASKDKSRNVVPNFLSLHTNLSSPETNTGDSLGQTSTQVISSKKLIKNKDDHRLISENKSETINEDKIPHKTSKKRLKEKSTLEDETGIIDKDDFKVKNSKEYSKEDLVLLREGSSKNYDSSNDVIPKSENFNNQNDILETPFEKYDDHAAGTPLSECSKTAENIASVIKYLEEQEELEGSSDTADQTKKEVLKTKPKDDSHVTTANASSSEASDGKNEDETESILQSDSSYTEIKDNIPDSPTDRANKFMLKNIINAFENNTTNILTGEATTIEGEAKAMPLKLSAKRKQFGKKLESILKGQISPGQIPYHSAKDSNIDLIEDTPNAEKLCSPEKNEEVKNNQKDSESNSSQPEECSSIGSRGNELNISDEANRDVEEEGDVPGNTILISPGGSTFQEIEYIDQVKSCSIDMESESELKKEEIVQNDHVKAPHDENDYQDHTFSPSTNSRGIKKSVSEGETKATIDYHSFRKCKSSDYPDMGKSHEQGLPPTPDHIKLSISDDSTIAANIAKTIFDITQSSNDLKSPDLSDDDSTLHTGERISKKILASIENDGLPTSSNMLSSKISSPDKHSKRASKSPDENTPEESIINNELINLLYSPRDSNEGNSTGLIDRPRSDLGKLYKSKDEGNTGWSQGRKTSSV